MPRRLPHFIVALFVLALAGCSGGKMTQVAEETTVSKSVDVSAEAYLFDAKVVKDKKVTSFRLDVYQTDSIIGISGRGYLGKGALKGWLSSDSIRVIFPSTKEYVYESVDDLFGSFDCAGELPDVRLFDLFSRLPDSLSNPPAGITAADFIDRDRVSYTIQQPGCPWQLDIIYDRQNAGWRIREFAFNDGHDNMVSGVRRIYKGNATVSSDRFEVTIPSAFTRLIP